MAQTQTKINFAEKKKSSQRLRESLLKELKCKTILNEADTNCSFRLARKHTYASNELKSPCMKSPESIKSQNKENKMENYEVCKQTPSVVLRMLHPKHFEDQENREQTPKHSPRKRVSGDCYDNDCYERASPPKRECASDATVNTPSQLISSLELNIPTKSEVQLRKSLFPKGEFDEACKALHSCAPTSLPCREDKLGEIKEFLLNHSKDKSSGTLYIAGPPGTGKSACVNIAVEDPQIMAVYTTVCVNCTTLNSSGSVYGRIVRELRLKTSGSTEKACLAAIEKHLQSKKRKMILLVLDELDQLCTSKQSILYSLFEWPATADSRVVLIGIANALDLTDRVLPRLQARLALRPTLLHFSSYTRQQIVDIINDRLCKAGVEEMFSGATLALLAGKVAAVNGDVRRALDIARRVVEMAERRTILQPLSNNGPLKQTVALQEVMTVVSDVYSTSQTLDTTEADSFPLQQKLLICSLLLVRQKSKTKDLVTIGKLHDVYRKVCERRNMSALDISEFISLVSLVEARGVLRVTGKNPNRLSKIILQWDETEVKSSLQDKQLLASVLTDKTVIN